MLNATILSLNVLSMMHSSPFYSLYNTHQTYLKSTFINSHFVHFFSNVFISFTPKHETSFQNCLFSQILDSSIKLNDGSDTYCFLKSSNESKNIFKKGSPIENQIIEKRSYFTKSCGNITINKCIFNGCHSAKSYGGSIDIEQKCFVIIYNTIFNNSSTDQNCGGACYIVKSQGEDNPPEFDDSQLPQLNVEYCCFQNCYGNKNLYGVALFSASKKTKLQFTSSVNCPGFQRTATSGAQFDMQANNIESKHINATQGHATHCSGIEIRYASKGYFKFQTIYEMVCLFAVAFTNIEKLELSYSNIYNISLIMPPNSTDYPGVIYVQEEDADTIKIDHFCFFEIDFGHDNNNSKLVTRGIDPTTRKFEPIHIVLINCTYDFANSNIALDISPNVNYELIGCQSNIVKLNTISHLNLGECRGEVTAPPFPVIGSNDHKKKDKNKTLKIALIAGIVGGIALILIILIIVLVVISVRKRKANEIQDINVSPDHHNVVHNENPIYDRNADEDPFRKDFLEN